MASIVIAPNVDIEADDFFLSNTTAAVGETLKNLLSQTGGLNLLNIGQVVSKFGEYAFTLGDRTFRYIGDFTSTLDQDLTGSVSSVVGDVTKVVIEEAGQAIATLNLDSPLGLDLGSVTSGGLLGLNLGDLTGGLLGDLLGDGPSSLLGSLTGSTDDVIKLIQDLLDDVVDPTDPTDPTDPDLHLHLTGDATANVLTGGIGNDVIHGLDGDDVLKGGAGDDLIHGDAGNDLLHGEAGNDELFGGGGKDQLWGGLGNDVINGDAGRDKLYGDEGSDKLYGGTAADLLSGGEGNDILVGGSGRDTMSGGAGADVFVFLSAKDSKGRGDVITDFNLAQGDTLDFSKFKHAEFIGDDDFSGTRGEIQVEFKGGNTFIHGDFNGDGKAEFHLTLEGTIKLDGGDFAF